MKFSYGVLGQVTQHQGTNQKLKYEIYHARKTLRGMYFFTPGGFENGKGTPEYLNKKLSYTLDLGVHIILSPPPGSCAHLMDSESYLNSSFNLNMVKIKVQLPRKDFFSNAASVITT